MEEIQASERGISKKQQLTDPGRFSSSNTLGLFLKSSNLPGRRQGSWMWTILPFYTQPLSKTLKELKVERIPRIQHLTSDLPLTGCQASASVWPSEKWGQWQDLTRGAQWGLHETIPEKHLAQWLVSISENHCHLPISRGSGPGSSEILLFCSYFILYPNPSHVGIKGRDEDTERDSAIFVDKWDHFTDNEIKAEMRSHSTISPGSAGRLERGLKSLSFRD